MSKKKFDPTDTAQIADELDQSGFFRPPSAPLPTPVPTPTTPNGVSTTNNPAVLPKQISSDEDMKNSSFEEMKKRGNEEVRPTTKRDTYKKVNYRLCPEAIEAIEDTKLLLQRKYKIKATYEDIAEVIILEAYQDLLTTGKESMLVRILSSHEDLKK